VGDAGRKRGYRVATVFNILIGGLRKGKGLEKDIE